MSGGPAVVDSLAEFEKRFGWPTEPSHLLDGLSYVSLLPNWPWQAMAPSTAAPWQPPSHSSPPHSRHAPHGSSNAWACVLRPKPLQDCAASWPFRLVRSFALA